MKILNLFLEPIRGSGIIPFIRRKGYAVIRRLVPSVKERHRLDEMIGPFGFWDLIQNYQINFFKQMGLKPNHSLLDIGCGPLSGGLAFISYLQPGRYVGMDISSKSITEAHIQVAKAGLSEKNPFLIVSNTFGQKELASDLYIFDYIWASQMLYHLDEQKVDDLFKQVSIHMNSKSKFYTDIIGYPNNVKENSRWHEFSFFLHTFDFLKTKAKKYGLTMKRLGKIEDFGYPKTLNLRTNDMLEFQKILK